ncbi:unnamed protein product [Leptidea sinapis]|uniref:Uncharacterized protein n=1 Tax=Leptidea sinapis TaxID=189913 RepID=A0A5E4Q2V0_9NEOP|nr:unnamed protein product [Leptidea sinapis]
MFSGKDAANPAYPTQWALNPTAYQNVDDSQVDWAALAQQWIAMKEAEVIVGTSQLKAEEGGEAPMDMEIPSETSIPPGAEWNSSTNSWGGPWNQWGWGWPSGAVDPKMPPNQNMPLPPMADRYPVPENAAEIPGYTTGTVPAPAPSFQHGYWTAPQVDQSSDNKDRNSRTSASRSKSRNRESKLTRSRPNRERPLLPPVVEPAVPPVMSPLDAAKRRQLPAWIREGLEKMEREKQKALEREQEAKAQEIAEMEKKRLEEEELQRLKAAASGEPETDSEGEESEIEETEDNVKEEEAGEEDEEIKKEPVEANQLGKKICQSGGTGPV